MTNELAVIEQSQIAVSFAEKGGVKTLLDNLAEELRKEIPDLTTKKGRDRIASLAYKVSQTKTMVDNYGKELVSAEKKRLSLIDDDRKLFRDGCDALRDEIRKPLTDWEDAEKSRIQAHKDAIAKMCVMANTVNLSAEDIANCLSEVSNIELGDHWQEFAAEAGKTKDDVLSSLRASYDKQLKHEQEQAELARLREEAEKREQIEREQRIAKQAADRARAEAEEKALREKLEAEYKAKAEQEAVERLRIAAEQAEARAKAEAEAAILREQEANRRRIEQEERAKVEAAQAAIRAEAQQKAAIEAERQRIESERIAQEQAELAEEAKRLANKEHKRKINRAIITEMLKTGITEEQAKDLIARIASGTVPAVSIKY